MIRRLLLSLTMLASAGYIFAQTTGGGGGVPGAGGGGGAVSSVFGRTGAVAATNGDYTASQVGADASGAAAAAQAAAIAASDPAGAAATAQSAAQAFSSNASNLSSGRVTFGVTSYLTPYTSYDAWGDSITAGAYLSSAASDYVAVIGRNIGLATINHGVGGTTTNSSVQAILNGTTANSVAALESIALGTNDVTQGGNNADQAADFGQGYLEEVAWIAIPSNQKTIATAFAYTGTPVAGTYTQSKKMNTIGQTATFTATGSDIVLATVMQATSGVGGTGSLTCDGVATGATLNFTGITGTTILAGTQAALTIVTGLTNTTHTCVVTQTGAGIDELIWSAGLSGSSQTLWPTVLVGSIPMTNPDTVNPSKTIYRPYSASAVTNLNTIGLSNVFFVDNTTILTAPFNYYDSLHPNDGGSFLLATPYLNVLFTHLGYTLPSNSYQGAPLVDRAPGGSGNLWVGPSFTGVYATTTGTANVGVGLNAGNLLTTGFANTTLNVAGSALTTGFENTLLGDGVGGALSTQSSNTAVGYASIGSGLPTQNAAFAQQALCGSNGAANTGIGYLSGCNGVNTITGSNNMTLLGANTGQSVVSATTLTDSTAVGAGALVGASHQFVAGASTVTDFYAGSTTGAANLHGNKLLLATARKGTFTCTGAGTITISNTNEAITSDVVISMNTPGGTITTPPAMNTVTAGTGFTVLCGATDTSVYNYSILN